MDIDIRSHIINNFKNDDKSALKEAIEESIKSNDEITLPGEGVFFELVWNNSTKEEKDRILDILEKAIKDN